MAQGTGRIVDFTKPNADVLSAADQPRPEIRRVDATKGVEVEVRQHEQLVIEGDGQIRQKQKDPSDPDVRLRISDLKAWDRIKRMEDE
jgi:hypothetical protein